MSVVRADIPGRPTPKARPQVRKNGHVYTPSSAQEEAAAIQLRALLKGVYFDSQVIVCMFFYGADPRADLDNLGKLVLDALVKAGVLKDDRLVTGLWLERRPADRHGPHTTVAIEAA